MFIKRTELELLQDAVLAACSRCGNEMCNDCNIVNAKETVERILGSQDPVPPNEDEYYDYVLRDNPEYRPAKVDPEKDIVYAIVHDLRDRRGLRQEFEACDPDIKDEIMTTWLGIVRAGGEA